MIAPPWPSTSRGLQASLPSCSVVFIVIERLSFPCVDRGIGMAVRVKSFRISKQLLYFHRKPGVSAFVEEFSEKMNVRPELKEAVLLQRMKFWLIRAKHGPIGNCSKSRGRKNYLALVRRHPVLAARHGLRETDIFLTRTPTHWP
jgi:hypothetical protein